MRYVNHAAGSQSLQTQQLCCTRCSPGRHRAAADNHSRCEQVTNIWIHGALVADQSSIKFYVNGERVADREFGFFMGNSGGTIPFECQNNAACDMRTGTATLSTLNRALGTITMDTDIFLGGRMDLDNDRHFKGKLAGLTLASTAMSAAEASCVFQANEGLLPRLPECAGMLSEMMLGGNFELDLSLLQGDSTQGTTDRSSKHRTIHEFGGDIVVTATGAQFDGDNDYIAIDDFDYESDGDFTIGFWITKNDCKDGNQPYEYLYSHVQNTDGDHTSIEDTQNSNINIYIGCEKEGEDTINSSVDGTVVRFNLIDGSGTWVLFDYPLQAGGDFDTLTHRWIHVIMTVTRHSVHAFFDGIQTDDGDFGFPTGTQCSDMHIRPSCEQLIASPQYTCSTSMEVLTGNDPTYRGQTLADYCQASCHQCTGGGTTGGNGGAIDSGMLNNAGYPYPSVLGTPLADFDLRSSIFLGSRSDLATDRHFLGKMALLKIYSSPVSNAEASCLFHDGEEILVDVGADGGGHRRQLAAADADKSEIEAQVTEERRSEERDEEEEGEAMVPARQQKRPAPLPAWMSLPYEPTVL